MSNLKRIRESEGLSQSELARVTGVSVRMIQYYEQGYKDINKASVETAIRLARALRCDVEELLEETHAEGKTP